MESTTADELWDPIMADVEQGQDAVAADMVDVVQQRLSVEVTRLPTPVIERLLLSGGLSRREEIRLEDSLRRTHRDDPIYGGGYKLQRSIRGEPARMETGRLRASFEHASINTGDVVEVAIYSDVNYAAYLESDRYGRLILTDLADTFLDPMLDAAVRGIEGV